MVSAVLASSYLLLIKMQLAIFGASAATYNMIVVLDLNSSSTSPKGFSLGYGVVGIVGTVLQFCVECHPVMPV